MNVLKIVADPKNPKVAHAINQCLIESTVLSTAAYWRLFSADRLFAAEHDAMQHSLPRSQANPECSSTHMQKAMAWNKMGCKLFSCGQPNWSY